MRWRYLVVCLLAGVGVSATVGAVSSLLTVIVAGREGADQPGTMAGVALGATVAGLLIGAAIGAVLGGLSGLLATLTAGGTRDPRVAQMRVGLTVLVTFLVSLVLVTGLRGTSVVAGGQVGWELPTGWAWAGVLVPAVLAALVSGLGARAVATMPDETA